MRRVAESSLIIVSTQTNFRKRNLCAASGSVEARQQRQQSLRLLARHVGRVLREVVGRVRLEDRFDYDLERAERARYGQVDTSWLLGNLAAWVADGRVNLALEGRAVYAFDHFLLARHHMFLMVYFHHKSVIYEEMLRRHVDGSSLVRTHLPCR